MLPEDAAGCWDMGRDWGADGVWGSGGDWVSDDRDSDRLVGDTERGRGSEEGWELMVRV